MSQMRLETLQSPSAVELCLRHNAVPVALLAARLRAGPPPFVVTVARGSSDNAALWLKYLIEAQLGVMVASLGPSANLFAEVPLKLEGALYVTLSQSGRSPDLLSALSTARAAGALTVAIVNDVDSPLARAAEIVLPLCVGQERSIAATKSCLATMALGSLLVAEWSDNAQQRDACRDIGEQLRTACEFDWSDALPLSQPPRSVYVLGRGPGLAIASEVALKLKEVCLMPAESISAAEVMHGPLALAGPDLAVLAFVGADAGSESVLQASEVLQGAGCSLFMTASADHSRGSRAQGVSAGNQHLASLQSFYLSAETRSRAMGLNPDHPPLLRKVMATV